VEAQLTDAGRVLQREAEAAHAAAVRARFLDHVDAEELAALAAVFRRFAPRAAERCDAVAAGDA
jgi:DNA-binding MarR family transcriptional regulator